MYISEFSFTSDLAVKHKNRFINLLRLSATEIAMFKRESFCVHAHANQNNQNVYFPVTAIIIL